MTSVGTQRAEWLAHLESALEVLNEGVVIIDDQRRVLFANSRFVDMTGISKQDLIECGPSHFYSPEEWDFVARQVDVEFREGYNRYEFVVPRKDGSRLPVIVSSRALEHSGGRFGIVTFTDISEQVRVEKELRSANAALHERQMEIEEDLRLAARVQKSLVPKSVVLDNVSVDAFYLPVHSIGGDFAMAISGSSGQVNVLVCDVSGHGIGSALVANRMYSETTAHLRSEMPLTQMLSELNRFLLEDISGSGMFVTAVAARIDASRRRLLFAGAGHPPAMLARLGQEPVLLESQNMILGVMREAVNDASDVEMQLEPDDRVIFYTDGISEVFNSAGEMLGIAGLQQIVGESSSSPGKEMRQRILDGVNNWREGAPTDDISLIVAHIT